MSKGENNGDTINEKEKEQQEETKNLTIASDGKDLPELPKDLLQLIANRLDVVGFCVFGAVCKSWWEIYDRSKEAFLESQAPMVVLTSQQAENACYLSDIAKGNTKKVMLPNLDKKFIIGCSAGYMIMEDLNHQILLVNPLSGHELNCNIPPLVLKGEPLHDLNVLISTCSSTTDAILVICNNKNEVQVFHSGTKQWLSKLFFGQPWVDIAIFKEQVFVVTKTAQVGKLRKEASYHSSNRVFCWLSLKNIPIVDSHNLKLVASNNQLLMVDFVPMKYLNIHKIDFDSMEWVKLDKLGDQALFLGEKWGSSIRKPGKWGGQSNCVYCLESTMYSIYSMEAELIGMFPLVENPTGSQLCSEGWYYPHQCMKLDNLTNY